MSTIITLEQALLKIRTLEAQLKRVEPLKYMQVHLVTQVSMGGRTKDEWLNNVGVAFPHKKGPGHNLEFRSGAQNIRLGDGRLVIMPAPVKDEEMPTDPRSGEGESEQFNDQTGDQAH